MNPLESDEEFQLSFRNPNPSFKALKSGDVYLMGFEMSKEEWEYFTDPNIDRTGMVIENICRVTHRAPKPSVGQISDVPATTLPVSTESEPVKGGKWSQEAGKMCNNPLFWKFLEDQFNDEWLYIIYHGDDAQSRGDFVTQVMKYVFNIKSRKELDTNIGARNRFMDMMSEFNRWTTTKLPTCSSNILPTHEQALKKHEPS